MLESSGGLQRASVTQPLAGTGLASLWAPPHPMVPTVPQFWPSVLRHSLSGTRISQGTGIVGLLSLTSITTTVSVAEPMSGGVPRSIAVTTKLWAGMRVRLVPTHVTSPVYSSWDMHCTPASHLGHELQVCMELERVHVAGKPHSS